MCEIIMTLLEVLNYSEANKVKIIGGCVLVNFNKALKEDSAYFLFSQHCKFHIQKPRVFCIMVDPQGDKSQ